MREITSPVVRVRNHHTGCLQIRSTTDEAIVPAALHSVMPAKLRRTTTPPALTTPIAVIRTIAVTTAPVPTFPLSNRGAIAWSMTRRTAYADNTVQIA
jgi:hypothetical protein